MLSLVAVFLILTAAQAEQQPDVFTICDDLSLSRCQLRTRRFVSNTPVEVKYFLHTRENGETPTVLEGSNPNVTGTPYRSNRPTKFIIHGFRSRGDVQWVVDMANALLEAEDLNVFAVDWRKGASPVAGLHYLQAKVNCRTVGQTIGRFVSQLGQPGNMIHIIGHSLGAHAAGFAGKVTLSTGFTVARISGLDPAGPRFESASAADRLDRSDAMFVDVIHTDVHTLGIRKPVGHVDFYPNEGWLQPGCKLFSCSHSRAYQFYTESISPVCQFLAYRCPNWETFNRNQGQCDVCGHSGLDGACSVMGYPSINYPDSQGSMYLVTSMEPPPHCETSRRESSKQCVQSLGSDIRQKIRDYVDSTAAMMEMGLQGDFNSMYSEMGTVVANMTAPMPNCVLEDIPVILDYIAGGDYDTVVAWASDGAYTLPSAMLIIALQLIAAAAVLY